MKGVDRLVALAIISFMLVDGVLADSLADRLFQLAGLEECGSVGNAGNGLVGLEDHAGHADIELLAGLEVESEAAKHNGNETAGSCADNEVKVVAWLGDFVAAWGAALGFDKGAMHEFLDDDEHGIATDTATVCFVSDNCLQSELILCRPYREKESAEADPWWCPSVGRRMRP